MIHMSLTPAPDHELHARHRLADAVVECLTAAGLPAALETPNGPRITGAGVEVDQFDDEEGGGVFVHWSGSPELAEDSNTAVMAHDYESPAIQLNGAIAGVMADALLSILNASGLRAEISEDEYRPYSLKVLRGRD
ncbi:hypothetical protein [Phycicoccus sp. Root563]|uniref:hypothetical protein n=1 Tax=Phycicoccus sp. Root563 TaxID=1736562 RepID=UPI00070353ED|nr:hypothetical protein [Phycicoccus sp. Root563]